MYQLDGIMSKGEWDNTGHTGLDPSSQLDDIKNETKETV